MASVHRLTVDIKADTKIAGHALADRPAHHQAVIPRE
jgi:hypothetical protein